LLKSNPVSEAANPFEKMLVPTIAVEHHNQKEFALLERR